MKLRLTKNSIRLRLSQSEIKRFAEKGSVQEELRIGTGLDQSLLYCLARTGAEKSVTAILADNRLTVKIPKGQANEWCETEQVGIEASQSVAGREPISILIEKDFACLTPRHGDDDKDSFPHPKASERC